MLSSVGATLSSVIQHEQQFKSDAITWLHMPLQQLVLFFTLHGWWLLYDTGGAGRQVELGR